MKPTLREAQSAPLLGEAGLARAGKLGVVFALAGAALFSTKAIFIKLAYREMEGLEPVTLLFLRFGFALPVYLGILAWAWRTRPPDRRIAAQSFALGLLGYHLCAWLDFQGLVFITAQLERLLLFTYPAFVLILGAVFFGGRVTKGGLLAVMVAYSGIALVFARGDMATGLNVPLGSALVLGCALLFALFQLLAKPRIDLIGSTVFTCLALIGATCGVVIHYTVQTYALGAGDAIGSLPSAVVGLGLALAVLGTLMPSFLTNMALARIGAQAVAVLAMIGPLVTIVLAVIVLGEPFGWVDALGTAITLSGIALYTVLDQREKARVSKTSPTPVTR